MFPIYGSGSVATVLKLVLRGIKVFIFLMWFISLNLKVTSVMATTFDGSNLVLRYWDPKHQPWVAIVLLRGRILQRARNSSCCLQAKDLYPHGCTCLSASMSYHRSSRLSPLPLRELVYGPRILPVFRFLIWAVVFWPWVTLIDCD